MHVLVVRHHQEDGAGLVGEAFDARGDQLSTVLVEAPGDLPDVGAYDHVVVLGATASAYDPAARERWVEGEVEWLRRALARGTSVLGICFGAQLLADAHGGRVERAPAYEIGWVSVDPVGPAQSGARVGPGPWFQFHGDRCVLPPGAEVLARNDVCDQAFVLGRTLGVQFHPEVDAAQLRRWFEHGGRRPVEKAGLDPDALLEQTSDEERAARTRAAVLVETFLRHVAQ